MFKPSINASRFLRPTVAVVLTMIMCLSNPLAGFAAGSAVSIARLVIQFSPGDTIVREVHFSTPTITGLQALEQTDLAIVTQDSQFGTFVCSINGIGTCSGVPKFWDYQLWSTGTWQEHSMGAGSTDIADGAVEGWLFHAFGDSNALPAYTSVQPAISALDWLRTQQNGTDGSISSPLEALLALGSNHEKTSGWQLAPGDPTFTAYLMANEVINAKKGADTAGKLATGLHAAGGCWVGNAPKPSSFYNPVTGAFGTGSYGAGHQAWAILGDKAFGEAVPAQAVTYLKNLVQSNGGWEWDAGFGSDSNTTALVIEALVAAGEQPGSTIIQNALTYLHTLQNDDGGFYYQPANGQPGDSDTNSTAYVVMSILAVGQNPVSWTKTSYDPYQYLLGLQLSDGSFQYQAAVPGANIIATDQAITALLGKYYPLPGSSLSQCPTLYLPAVNH